MPVLHYLGGFPLETSILGSLCLVFCVASGSGFAHRRQCLTDGSLVRRAVLTAIPCGILGALTSIWLVETSNGGVLKAFAFCLTFWVLVTTISRERGSESSGYIGLESLQHPKAYSCGVGIGGFSSGLMGVGGGAIYVTMNRRIAGLGVRESAGTSFLTAIWVQPIAFSTHILAGDLSGPSSEPILIASIAMFLMASFTVAYIGARFSFRHLPVKAITSIFIFILSVSLLRYAADFVSVTSSLI